MHGTCWDDIDYFQLTVLLMSEGLPVPITRGIDIQKEKIYELQKQALAQYKELAELSRIVDAQLDLALSNPKQENLAELKGLFAKKHAVDEVGDELEKIIVQTFNGQYDLMDRWLVIEKKFTSLEKVLKL